MMKVFLYSSVLALIVCGLSFGQATFADLPPSPGPLQTGFAIITPLSGNGAGLNVSETFIEQTDGGFFQASVVASPLITLTSVVVSSDPTNGLNTGIAIVNPNTSPAVVTFNLHDQQGLTAATRTMIIGPRQQISLFATQLFAGSPVFDQPITGLLFINSDVPVAVVALAFNGAGFTALPVAFQLNPNNNVVAVAVSSTATIPSPVASVSIPVTPTFNGVPTPPTILPTPTFTVPAVTVPITGVTTTLGTSTGVLATGSQFSAVPTVPGFSTTLPGMVSTPTIAFFPQPASAPGGVGPAILPQVVTGAGWRTQITIVNTLPFTQTVGIDFFNASGGPMALPFGSSMSDIVVPAGGVATIVL